MAQKSKSVYVCSNCGYETPKWLGKCPECLEWSTLQEEIREVVPASKNKSILSAGSRSVTSYALSDISPDNELRYKTGMKELD